MNPWIHMAPFMQGRFSHQTIDVFQILLAADGEKTLGDYFLMIVWYIYIYIWYQLQLIYRYSNWLIIGPVVTVMTHSKSFQRQDCWIIWTPWMANCLRWSWDKWGWVQSVGANRCTEKCTHDPDFQRFFWSARLWNDDSWVSCCSSVFQVGSLVKFASLKRTKQREVVNMSWSWSMTIPSLKLTASLHLKIGGWEMILSFWGLAYFQRLLLLV